MTKNWGASPDDWTHLDLVLGLGQDLLPVVSNPHAEVSAKSAMKALGKTPSLYNRDGNVAGILNWTSKKATNAELERWAGVSDYGICLQTRRVRALDVDVGDEELALAIEHWLSSELRIDLPKRFRADSAKRLFAFIVEGELPKRVLPVEGGIVEFLGNGQQAVVSGTHPAGARYEWAGGLPIELPVLSVTQFDTLWSGLSDGFGTGEGRSGSSASRKRDDDIEMNDSVLPLLTVTGWSRDKRQAYIDCPWKESHSMDSGISQTVYFPAGTRGYETGHFRCLHAHCMGKSDADFLEALGITAAGFDLVTDDEVKAGSNLVTLDYDLRLNDDGMTLATVENLHAVLTRPDLCGQHICYDTFRDEIVWKPIPKDGESGTGGWQPLKDTDYTRLRAELALTGFLPIGRELMRDTVHRAAVANIIDTAQEWLRGLVWDGIPRVSGFLHKYMETANDPYTEAVSRYMWTALAGRIVSPGCKADAALIFVGEQYIGKSYAASAIVPDRRCFTEFRFDEDENNLSRKMRGKLVAEFSELSGFRTKALESIKAFITRQEEEWVPKYMEFATVYPRRLLFIGTTNSFELFGDETGNRRWFPIEVKKADIAGIKNDRDQLWAEGAAMFLDKGIHYYYDRANGLAQPMRDNFMITDPWEDSISEWLYKNDSDGNLPANRDFLQVSEILWEVLTINPRERIKFQEMRVAKILAKLGYKRVYKRINGDPKWVWAKM